MNRSKKKSFDWHGARQRFSIRKYHIGAASVLLGMTLVLSAGTIVSAETGVNGDGASNGQILPGNGTGTSDGTQPQGDNQGVNSSGVQTGNTTNSTANDQSANDTGSASSQPVVNPRTMSLKPEGDGTTNPTVDEPIIKFPTQANQTKPDGYQSVEFYPVPGLANLNFEGNPGEITSGNSKKVVFWVKTGTTWGELKNRIPKYTAVHSEDFILGYARSVGEKLHYIDFNDSFDNTAIVDQWKIVAVVDYIVGEVDDGKTFEEYMKKGYEPFYIPQFHGITLDANGGTVGGKAKKAFYVAYQHVQWGDPLVTKKIVDPSRDGYTFVRWQTDKGEGIPTSGQIETTEFSAVWLKHPEEAVKVFNPAQLSETDKTEVADLIRSVNTDLKDSIQEITVANNGDATVRFTTGEERTISGASLVSDNSAEQRTKAEEAISDAVLQKQDDIAKSQLTAKEQQDKLDKLRELQESIEEQIDGATSEDALDKIVEDGKNSIENFDLTSATKKDQAKQDLEKAYNTEKAEIENSVLTADEKVAKQAELTTAKEKAIKAVDDATTDSAVEGALNNGKATIESTYTAIIKIPSSASEPAPQGYVTVTFGKHKYTRGFTLGTQTGETVKVFVKNGVKWGELLDDPAWQWPTVKTDEGDTVVGWSVNDYNYKPGNAFARDNYKDTDVTNITLYPNVVFEVEDVHSTIDAYLKQYGADEQDKWLFVTFDAGQGATLKGTTNQSKSVAVYYQNIGYDNSLFTKKVVNGVLANHTFVRWQTADGKVLPTSGTITSTEVYNALYLAHPTDKTTVFDANKLTETEKDSLKQAISNANPTSANLIQSITVSDTGEATVTYNDGTVVTVPASNLINEDKEPARNLAKEEIDKASKEKVAEINASALTDEEKAAKLTEVQEAKDRANNAIDNATTTEDLTKALEDGKSEINAINTTTSAEKAAAKQTLEDAYNAKKDAITNSGLTAEEKDAKQAELDKAKEEADKAIEAATDNAGVAKALEDGKSAIAGIDTSTSPKKAAAKQDLEEAYNAKKDAITNSGLTAEEKATKQAELDKAKETAENAIDTATDDAGVDTALNKGKADIAAFDTSASPKKATAKQDLEEAYNAKKAEIENSVLTAEEKAAKQAELDKAKETAENAIDTATDDAGVDTALNKGKADIAAFDTSASPKKATAKQDLEEAYNAKKAEIENSVLTAEEKATKQAALDKAKADAEKAIDAATDNAGVDTALAAGKTAIAAIDTTASTAKADAKKNLEEAYNAKKDAITNSGLTAEEKATKQAELDKAKADVDKAIDTATDNAGVAKALEDGKAAIDAIDTSTSAKKAQAKEELKAVADDAKKAIDANDNLTDAEKQAAKDAVDAEVAKAEKTIDAATKGDEVDAATLAGTKAIAEDVLDAAKQDAKNKIAKDLATVEAAIDANSNLSQDEKDAAKLAAQAKEAEAVANIEKATTPEAAQTLEDAAVKDLANIEIKAAYDDAVKAIEAADNLSTAAKTKALDDLKKARQAAEEAVKNATTADEVAKGALDGLKSIAKIEATAAADDAKAAIEQNANLIDAEKKVYTDAIDKALKDTETKIDAATDADTVDAETIVGQKAFAKEEVKATAEDAIKGIEANTNLSDAEKDEYKATVTKAAETAEKAIADATTAADIQSKTFDATQDVAKEEVKADAADAIAGIKANDNLSDTAKEEAIAAIEEARDTTLENIENAKTAADVDTATLDAEKANAKAEIKAAADDAKKAIDENA
ncbi:DUF1542 domain-containing protein, partial [Streptococcus suis]|uniref:DUF1542 domain-containing protein n=1 Tax=Streptococcus suis TaxID=1307 RepID=UPI0012900142